MKKIEEWQRQDGEPDPAFSSFVIYRDMGPGRSLSKLAEMTGTPLSTEKARSAQWNFRERATAYDRHLDGVRLGAVETAEKQRALASREAVSLLSQATIIELVKALDEAKTQPFSTFKIRDLIKATEAISKLSNLLDGGGPTERIEVTGVDLSGLSDGDLDQLAALAAKAAQ